MNRTLHDKLATFLECGCIFKFTSGVGLCGRSRIMVTVRQTLCASHSRMHEHVADRETREWDVPCAFRVQSMRSWAEELRKENSRNEGAGFRIR